MIKWRMILVVAALLMTVSASAAIEIPKESRVLGATKTKQFSTGLVFIDGKYIEPPYVVERWGVGIKVNGIPAVAQVVPWTDFIRTQEGVKVTKSESAAPEATESEPEEEPEEEVEEEDDDSENSLDDLFDDDPKPKKKAPAKKKSFKPKPRKPTVSVSYTLEGEFVPNDASKALLKRVNAVRQEIDKRLRMGGFVFFGENYAYVAGGKTTADQILEQLPSLMQRSSSEEEFISSIHNLNMVYITNLIAEGLYRNRVDYLKLQAREKKARRDREFNKLMNDAGSSLY